MNRATSLRHEVAAFEAVSFAVLGSWLDFPESLMTLKFDKIGYWSEVKLDIVKKYAVAYSKILASQKLSHVYIDGFCGAGLAVKKSSGEWVPGSPLNALFVEPPFDEFFFVDLNGEKVEHLSAQVGADPRVHVRQGDCNRVLLDEVFPNVQYGDYRRGLCLLDPYGLHLNWEVLAAAGELGTIDLFLNFPVMDMNMNALWARPEGVPDQGVARMTSFWGDDSWRGAAYIAQSTLFGDDDLIKLGNDAIVEAFRERLQKVASFAYVPSPMPMRNTKGAIVYYLFFASQQRLADKIVKEIFATHKDRRA